MGKKILIAMLVTSEILIESIKYSFSFLYLVTYDFSVVFLLDSRKSVIGNFVYREYKKYILTHF